MVHETWVSYKDKVSRFIWFSVEEWRNYLIITFLFGFLYSMRDWGAGTAVDIGVGITNWIISTVMFGIVLLIHVGGQRLHAIRVGHRPELRLWPNGLFLAIVVALLFQGHPFAILLFFGCTEIHILPKHRIGRHRYGTTTYVMGLVSLSGPYASLLFAYLLKILNVGLNSAIIQKMIFISLMMATLTMIPIPPMINGIKVFFWSRLSFVYNFTMILVGALLIWYTNNIFLILLGSTFTAFVIWLLYYMKFEEGAWG